jgi:hypothetical protein
MGAVCALTAAQAARLDGYERGYERTPVRVTLLRHHAASPGTWAHERRKSHAWSFAHASDSSCVCAAGAPPEELDAVAYVMTPPASFEAPPSEAYLCAIWRNLREAEQHSKGGAARVITQEDGDDAIPLLRAATAAERAAGGAAVLPLSAAASWRRPVGNAAALATLRAACYEAGVAARPPWELPRRAALLCDALAAAGVASVPALAALLREGRAGSSGGAATTSSSSPLRAALAAAGHGDALDAEAEAALAAALLAGGESCVTMVAAVAPAESGSSVAVADVAALTLEAAPASG